MVSPGPASSLPADDLKSGGIDFDRGNLSMNIHGPGMSLGPGLSSLPFPAEEFEGFSFRIVTIRELAAPQEYFAADID